MGIKFWLDDCRPAPGPDWLVATNYEEAVAILSQLKQGNVEVDVAQLDHDLGGMAYNYCKKCREKVNSYDEWHEIFIHGCEHGEKTGMYVVAWMERNNFWPKRVIIHSYNTEGAMRMFLTASKYTQTIILPYTGKEI